MRGVLVLSAFLFATPSLAFEPPILTSFAKPTSGGKYVLVMLHGHERPAEKGLKDKYGRSGLYPANDPTKPVWTCEWRTLWEANVFASDDGLFAVRVPDGDPGFRGWKLMNDEPVPRKATAWDDAPALFIYKNGQPFRTLALKDVFDCSQFTDRDCFLGPVVSIEAFRDAEGRVVITSVANEQKQTATIAFRTGEVIERGRSGGNASATVTSDAEGEPVSELRWSRVILVGLAVVGVSTAVLVGLVLALRTRARTD